jgi:hypothetical protein
MKKEKRKKKSANLSIHKWECVGVKVVWEVRVLESTLAFLHVLIHGAISLGIKGKQSFEFQIKGEPILLLLGTVQTDPLQLFSEQGYQLWMVFGHVEPFCCCCCFFFLKGNRSVYIYIYI